MYACNLIMPEMTEEEEEDCFRFEPGLQNELEASSSTEVRPVSKTQTVEALFTCFKDGGLTGERSSSL